MERISCSLNKYGTSVVHQGEQKTMIEPPKKWMRKPSRIAISVIIIMMMTVMIFYQDIDVVKDLVIIMSTITTINEQDRLDQKLVVGLPSSSSTTTSWNPRQYSDPQKLEPVLLRGLNVINAWSGCDIAAWIYKPKGDCHGQPVQKQLVSPTSIKLLGNQETIYVPFSQLSDFVTSFLPLLNTTITLFSCEFQKIPSSLTIPYLPKILDDPNVGHFFLCNVDMYAQGYENHEKLHPFPYGLKPKRYSFKRDFMNPIPHYQRVFVQHFLELNKTQDVFFSPLRVTNNSSRGAISQRQIMPYRQYLYEIAKSRYVVSPSGDRPECHRHYEALGLGAIPITDLSPIHYRHFKDGPIIYGVTDWNITITQEHFRHLSNVTVNRNMAFEEYWMESIERIVGHPLMWWDRLQGKSCLLQDFTVLNKTVEELIAVFLTQ